ncbi:MAG: hypothetical protein R6W77_10050 [Trueperaceae bacterium]
MPSNLRAPLRAPLRALTLVFALVAPGAFAAEQIVLGPVLVVYDEPALRPYAERVARLAAQELVRVAGVFGRTLRWPDDPPAPERAGEDAPVTLPVTVRITTTSDAFNAFGLPLPRPTVVVRALEPSLAGIGLGSDDALATLLRHELVHLLHLGDPRAFPPGVDALPDLGLVGQVSFPLPPAWLLEGLATWIESRPDGDAGAIDRGGRLFAPRTRAMLLALAADGAFPSLADVSLATFDAWPAGEARYLLGAAFVDDLVLRHGFETVLDAMHAFHAAAGTRTFAGAWRAVTGSDLEVAWAAWRTRLEEEAAQAFARTAAGAPSLLTAAGSVGTPAVAPDGDTVAWAVGTEVAVASLAELRDERAAGAGERAVGGADRGRASVRRFAAPLGLYAVDWLDADTLLLGGYAREGGALRSELFTMNRETGLLARATNLGRVRLPSADGAGCAWFVRDETAAGGGSGSGTVTRDAGALLLQRWCVAGRGGERWPLPAGVQVADVAAAPDGAVALLLVRGEERWLEVLGPSRGRAAQAAEPGDSRIGGGVRLMARLALPAGAGSIAWHGADVVLATVVDGDSARMLGWRARRGPGALAWTPWMASPATPSAFAPAAAADGVVFLTLRGTGTALAWWPWEAWGAAPDTAPGAVPDAAGAQPDAVSATSGRGSEPAAPHIPAPRATNADLPARDQADDTPDDVEPEPYRVLFDLAPYGWLPTGGRVSFAPLDLAFEVVVPAQDVTGDHEVRWTIGYDSALRGGLAGVYGSVRYGYRMPTLVPDTRPAAPAAFALTLGSWPHRPHRAVSEAIVFGVRIESLLRRPVGSANGSVGASLDLVAGAGPGWRLGGAVDAVLGDMRGDAFGLARAGWRAGWHARVSPTPNGPSFGTWLSADLVLGSGQGLPAGGVEGVEGVEPAAVTLPAPDDLRFGLVAGYRPTTPVPSEDERVVIGSVVARWLVPLGWRVGDGMWAWERLRVEPALRGWVGMPASSTTPLADAGQGTLRVGLGADVGIGVDVVLDYLAPVTLTLRGGFADGAWLRLEMGAAY